MNIMLWGVNPNHYSGLSKVGRSFVLALQKLGHNPIFVDYMDVNLNTKTPFPLYKKSNFRDESQLVEMMKYHQVEMIISIGDIWQCQMVYSATRSYPCNWVPYIGSEGITYPRYAPMSNKDGSMIDFEVMFSGTSAIWGYTEKTVEALRRSFPNLKKDYYSFPHCVDIDMIDKAEKIDIRKLFGIDNQRPIYLFVGDNLIRKGIDLFVQYVEHNYGIGVIVSPQEATDLRVGYNIEEMINPDFHKYFYLFDQVRTALQTPILSDLQIYGLMKGCDIFLHPHSAEGFGLTPLEALIAGAKVIATNTGGPSTYLPLDSKILFTQDIWLQMGQVGYWGQRPESFPWDVSGEVEDDTDLRKTYSQMAFTKNVEKMLAIKYKPSYEVVI